MTNRTADLAKAVNGNSGAIDAVKDIRGNTVKAANSVPDASALGKAIKSAVSNPTDGLIFAVIPGGDGETLPARVLDSKGALVLNTTLAAGAGPQPVQLPESVADGVYLLEVLLPDGKLEMLRFMVLWTSNRAATA